MDNHFVDLSVDYFSRDGGFWFASLQVGTSVHNAPSSTKANAALQAWSSYTSQQATLAAIRDDIGATEWTWPTRLTASSTYCVIVPDGTDTNGDVWNRCTVHDQLVFGDAYICEGYVAPAYKG
jgi:hypothetical protein